MPGVGATDTAPDRGPSGHGANQESADLGPPIVGANWGMTSLRLGFPETGFNWGSSVIDEFNNNYASGWSPATTNVRTGVRQALATIASQTPFTFAEASPSVAEIVVSMSTTVANRGVQGVAFYPKNGAVFILTSLGGDDFSTATPNRRRLLLHELGHALGLRHPTRPEATHDRTIMYSPWPTATAATGNQWLELDPAAVRIANGLGL